MTKDERIALQSKAQNLDLCAQVIQKGTYPGTQLAAQSILKCLEFLQTEFTRCETVINADLEKLSALMDEKKEVVA